jgi:hypothetical protein
MGEEEGMVVHVESQGQAVDLESPSEKVQMGQERFAGVEAGAGVVAGGVIQQIEQDLFVRGLGQERMGCRIVLPQGAVVTGLPASDGLGRGFARGVGSQAFLDRPATDAGAVGLEVEPTVQFAGGGAVGGRWFGGEKLGQQSCDFLGPNRMMITPGRSGRPGLGQALGTGAQVLAVKFVEPRPRQTQLASYLPR